MPTPHNQLYTAIRERKERTLRMQRVAQDTQLVLAEPRLLGREVPGWFEWPEIEQMMADRARDCERDLKVPARHRPSEDRTPWNRACLGCEHIANDGEYTWEWPCDEIRDLFDAYGVSHDHAAG